MRTSILLGTACAFALSTAATLKERVPILGVVGFWTNNDCTGEMYWVERAYGTTCDNSCHNFTQNGVTPTYHSVHEYTMNPQCLLTVYTTPDCSDPGIQSGTGGCWAPQPEVAAYTITCPWNQGGAIPVCFPE